MIRCNDECIIAALLSLCGRACVTVHCVAASRRRESVLPKIAYQATHRNIGYNDLLYSRYSHCLTSGGSGLGLSVEARKWPLARSKIYIFLMKT